MTGPAGPPPWNQRGRQGWYPPPPPVPPQRQGPYGPPPHRGPYGPPPWQQGPYPPPPLPPQFQPPPPPPPGPPTGMRRVRQVLNPFRAARKVFRPSRPDLIVDPRVRKLQFTRAWAGIVVSLWVAVVYRFTAPKELASERFNDAWINVLVLACVLPLVVGVFVTVTRPPSRGAFLRRVRYPLGALLAMFGSMFSCVVAVAPEFEGLRNAGGPALQIVGGIILFLWMLPFALYGILLSLAHVFRTADIHETVPPLASTSVAWAMAAVNLFGDSYEGVPPGLSAILLLGAPLTVTALAYYEMRRLRLLHGITLRNTLLR